MSTVTLPSDSIATVSPIAMIALDGLGSISVRVTLTWKIMFGARTTSLVSLMSKFSSLKVLPIYRVSVRSSNDMSTPKPRLE